MKEKCDKCDERGMIDDGGGAAHSCPCGKYNRIMEKVFKGLSIADLFNRLEARRISRGRFLPHELEEQNL